jgi:ppGpp synthetase/RelA/SpoT-type nucleotidyltranferase
MTHSAADFQADRWVREFERSRSKYLALEEAAVADLEMHLQKMGIRGQVHDIRHRVKEVASFREKVDRKSYLDPLNEMRDLMGIRIVCLYPSVLADVDEAVREAFDVIRSEDKSKGEAPELWRYSSIHYDCRLPKSHSGPRYDGIKGTVFEVQVRTLLQDAWAVVEHKLGYKNEKSIPDELKREFSALAGLFHIADNSFQAIADQVNRSEEAAKAAEMQLDHLYHRVDAQASQPVSREEAAAIKTQIAALESRRGAGIDRSNLKGLLRSLYSDRSPARDQQYSEFVEELAGAGIVSLARLRELLRVGHDSAVALEAKRPGFDSGRRLDDVVFPRLVMATTVPEFRRMLRPRQEPRPRP